jgi:hypothetical protein
MKKIILAIIAAVFIVPLAYAAGLVRLDTSQTNQYAPSAVIGAYKPYCDATGAVVGNFIPAASHMTYNASGVVSTISELDGASGVTGTNTFNTTITYSASGVTDTSCAVKQ